MASQNRCGWAKGELDIIYHDEQWGVPVHDDDLLFEMLTLEGAQAGLSWSTILKKREGYQKLFKGFDPVKVARMGKRDVERLMGDASIVRNRLKIESTISNAKALLKLQEAEGSFDDWLWGYVDGKTIVNGFKTMKELPAETALSKQISKDLKKRGFRFVGPTIVYAFMQAMGMVNDHLVSCFRYEEVG